MQKRREDGISIINIILVILIIISIGVIVFLVTEDSANLAQSDLSGNYAGVNLNSPATSKPSNGNYQNVQLSNDILNGEGSATPNVVRADRYFYSQLDSNGKKIYDNIYTNMNALKNGYQQIELGRTSEELDLKFQSSWDALSMDKPEIFFVDTKKISLITQTTKSLLEGTRHEYILQPQAGQNYFLNCWTTQQEVESAISQVEKAATQLVNNANNYSTRYDKVKYIHDYITEHTEYDQQGDVNNSDVYGNLIKGKSVCEGYAKTFKYLLDKMDIPCVVICGDGIADDGDTEFHAWNYVQMEDNNWYAVDTTWDDPIIIGNGTISDKTKYRHFLVGANSFANTHKEDGDVSGTGQNFHYPVLSSEDYKR